jgi:signal peptidase II
MSWFGSLGIPLFSSIYFAVGFNLLVLAVAIVLYRHISVNMEVRGKLTQTIFIFLFAAVLCSTIDRMLWGGSVDFIKLEGFFTFDIKDCYVSVFIVLFAFSYFKYRKKWDGFSFKSMINNRKAD